MPTGPGADNYLPCTSVGCRSLRRKSGVCTRRRQPRGLGRFLPESGRPAQQDRCGTAVLVRLRLLSRTNTLATGQAPASATALPPSW